MSVDHIVMYQKMTSNKRYGDPPLPDWVYKQTLNYPRHPKHSELIGVYTEAEKQYGEWVEVLQSAYQQKWQDPENAQKSESVKQCQQEVEEARKALWQASEALREFNNHTLEQRISLYETEIKEWKTRLAEAQKAEEEYTKQLLNDVDAAARRLERMVDGYSGQKAEYSESQLSKLRSLKNEVESIEAKILDCQRDIQRIHELVDQSERSSQLQATMDAALSKFNKSCAKFGETWGELQSLAAEHDIRIVNQNNLEIPLEATYRQINNPYEGGSTISLSF